jgi:proton glutamate symport protein
MILIVFYINLSLSLKRFMKIIWEPLTISFATASSEAVLPMAMENMELFGVPKAIVAFVIPTGYSFNLAGTTLYLGSAAIFAMQAGNVEKTVGEQVMMMFMLMIMSKGVAAVPRASIVILSSACDQFGLPIAAVLSILAVDQVLDMARTAVNLFGNCLACVVIAKWEGEFDPNGLKSTGVIHGIDDVEGQKKIADDLPVEPSKHH